MRSGFLVGVASLGLAACATQTLGQIEPAPQSAFEALKAYYDTVPESELPVAPAGVALPEETALISRILLASCNDEEKESPTLAQVAREDADLFLMVGDNVYGDRDGRAYVSNDADLTEVRESFADLAARPEFQAVRAKHPMMVAWDDHDYGENDGGGNFPFKGLAERIHETFWGLGDKEAGGHDGTYYAKSFGPEGQRVQIIMLDTRYFRSDLTPTDEWGKTGKERYLPSPPETEQDMLGAAQWTWLEAQLSQPAVLRFIATSIQVMPTVHGWEAWSTMPAERQRLFDLIDDTGATGVIFLSGDRHAAYIYEEEGVLPYAAHELTSSSLNVSFANELAEMDARQQGAAYPPENFGAVDIDWAGKTVSLSVKNGTGQTVRQNTIAFTALGLD